MPEFVQVSSVFVGKILFSVACGTLIGLERQSRGRPAGMRTSVLVCMGCMLFTHLGTLINGDAVDNSRVLGQVITGIGFIGGGVILSRKGLVLGVTSAAVLWVLAAIGAAIGLGYMAISIYTTVAVLVVLLGIERLEKLIKAATSKIFENFGSDE